MSFNRLRQYLIVFFCAAILLFGYSGEVVGYYSAECNQTISIASGTVIYGASIDSNDFPACTSIDTGDLGFQIPSLGDILTFAIRAFFVIAGLAALFYLLLGAMAWVTSGGDKDAITAAREKIQAAVLGMIMIVAVLAVIWTLEQVIFKRRICLGLSCPLTLPGLIETTGETASISTGQGAFPGMSTSSANCCVCIRPDGTRGDAINTFLFRCLPSGEGEPF
ncbi:hypothetical protein KBD81_00180 [Candidatus Woesebacteria bacterium]|nr:hypothetical protein [Candidatus Woesebacteria bacterium]